MASPPLGNRAKRPLKRELPTEEASFDNGGNLNGGFVGDENKNHVNGDFSDYYQQSPAGAVEHDTVPELVGPAMRAKRASKKTAGRERSVSFSSDVTDIDRPPVSPTFSTNGNIPPPDSTPPTEPQSTKAKLLRRLSSIPYAGEFRQEI